MNEQIKIKAKSDPKVLLRAIPGHFVTPNSHVNYFLDMTGLRSRLSEAQGAAKALADQISLATIVDTIVCIDGCEIIGAFMAEELTRAGIYSMNAHSTIYIVTPEHINSGQLMFRENILPMIKGKNVLLLLASASTGQTIENATQALVYYGAKITAISAVFSTVNTMAGMPINSLFHISDIPDYKVYKPHDCPLCRDGIKVDAIANGHGYSVV